MSNGKQTSEVVKLSGGEELRLLVDGVERTVFVRQLPIGELPKLAAAVAANGGFGDDEAIFKLYTGEEFDATGLDAEAIDEIHEAGERLNMGFLSRMLARSQRRSRLLVEKTAGGSAKSPPKFAGSPD